MGEGIVHIEDEWCPRIEPPVTCHHGRDDHVEPLQSVEFETVDDAITWGRRRAPVVIVRMDQVVYSHRWEWIGALPVRLNLPPNGRHRFYSAGETIVPEEARGEWTRWPSAPASREPEVTEQYGGRVFATHSRRGITEWGPFVARWEAPRYDGFEPPGLVMTIVERAGPAPDFDLRAAIAWGRERAEIVLLRVGWSQYHSVGPSILWSSDCRSGTCRPPRLPSRPTQLARCASCGTGRGKGRSSRWTAWDRTHRLPRLPRPTTAGCVTEA